MRSFDWASFIIVPALYLAALFWICWRYWRLHKAITHQATYTYRITDMYAFIIGMTPTMLTVRMIAETHGEPSEIPGVVLLAVCMGAAQVAGMFICSLDSKAALLPRRDTVLSSLKYLNAPPAGTAWGTALRIIMGGIFGLGLGCATFLGVGMIVTTFFMMYSRDVAVLVIVTAIVVPALVHWRRQRKRRAEQASRDPAETDATERAD